MTQHDGYDRPLMRNFWEVTFGHIEEAAQQSETQPSAFLERYRELVPNSHTWRALQSDWRDFLGEAFSDFALSVLFSLPNERIGELIEEYQRQLRQRGLKSSTRNRRMTSLRNLFLMAERQGWRTETISDWIIPEMPSVATRPSLDSDLIDQLLQAPVEKTLVGARDAVLLRLQIENGLSRAQLCALDIGDFIPFSPEPLAPPLAVMVATVAGTEAGDWETGANQAKGGAEDARIGVEQLKVRPLRRRLGARDPTGTAKGTDVATANGVPVPEDVALSPECAQKIGNYLQMLETQGAEITPSSPLFRPLDRRQLNNPLQNQRLTDDGVYAIVLRYARLLDVQADDAQSSAPQSSDAKSPSAPLTPRALQGLRPWQSEKLGN